MADEILLHHGTTMVRRLRLAPGEAMPWHRDPFQRVAGILGDLLSIEYHDGGESQRVAVMPGQVEREEPSARVYRAVNGTVGRHRRRRELPGLRRRGGLFESHSS